MVMIVMTGRGKCHHRNPKMAKTASETSKTAILEVKITDPESKEEGFPNMPKTF